MFILVWRTLSLLSLIFPPSLSFSFSSLYLCSFPCFPLCSLSVLLFLFFFSLFHSCSFSLIICLFFFFFPHLLFCASFTSAGLSLSIFLLFLLSHSCVPHYSSLSAPLFLSPLRYFCLFFPFSFFLTFFLCKSSTSLPPTSHCLSVSCILFLYILVFSCFFSFCPPASHLVVSTCFAVLALCSRLHSLFLILFHSPPLLSPPFSPCVSDDWLCCISGLLIGGYGGNRAASSSTGLPGDHSSSSSDHEDEDEEDEEAGRLLLFFLLPPMSSLRLSI